MTDDRMPPYDLDAEEAVLGSLLIDGDAIYKVRDFLAPEHFYRDKNQWIYEACCALYDRNEAINPITVAHELGRQGKLESLGGQPYLANIVANVPTSIHVEYYGKIVRRLAMMRSLIAAARRIEDIGYEAPPDENEALDRAENLLFSLRHGSRAGAFVHIREVLDAYFEETSLGQRPPGEEGLLPHINTGYTKLDKLLSGLHRSNLIILAARPSMGKTSLAINIARNAALTQGARVAIFSLEMSKLELGYRFISAESGITSQALRENNLNEVQRDRVMAALETLSDTSIYIDDSTYMRDTDMKSKARRLQSEKGVDLVIVDYIQLMRSARRTDNRVQEMTYISQSLKDLARDLDVPVLALSQLSRAAEQRDDHRPVLSDLRESGSIEQDADVVLFIYRDDAYYSEEQWERLHPGDPYPAGQAEIIVAKHRNGPQGRVFLHFDKRTTKFENPPAVPPEQKPALI